MKIYLGNNISAKINEYPDDIKTEVGKRLINIATVGMDKSYATRLSSSKWIRIPITPDIRLISEIVNFNNEEIFCPIEIGRRSNSFYKSFLMAKNVKEWFDTQREQADISNTLSMFQPMPKAGDKAIS